MMNNKFFVVYGHKLYSHTHSYIHYGFIKAFSEYGWNTIWIDNTDKNINIPSGTLFLTEGQVDDGIPIREDCYYILHNVKENKYANVPKSNKLILQVQLFGKLYDGSDKIWISDVSLFSPSQNCLYTCWATDLLPNEINIKEALENIKKQEKSVVFIGSINNCERFGNLNQILPFISKAKDNNYKLICNKDPFKHPIDNDSIKKLISSCKIAPTILGHWQQNNGYIPCRIFKTISYGCLGITNSKYVNNISNNICIYHEDSIKLFTLADDIVGYYPEKVKEILKTQMEWVKSNHTYINRIEDILKVFELKMI